ncbi:hypothetical protein [Oceanicoccus sp. KOV_DT_Chl]|uniref:hypothetical protein n=1 Tax=Oceanicoccus sp. KOV_DT_Chl TaxID=1904639 RepID=UPI000C7CC9B9|nr:hypothetical protein [Oceanicoccus sp. KOV_DT_Chl]
MNKVLLILEAIILALPATIFLVGTSCFVMWYIFQVFIAPESTKDIEVVAILFLANAIGVFAVSNLWRILYCTWLGKKFVYTTMFKVSVVLGFFAAIAGAYGDKNPIGLAVCVFPILFGIHLVYMQHKIGKNI